MVSWQEIVLESLIVRACGGVTVIAVLTIMVLMRFILWYAHKLDEMQLTPVLH